jgi:hypothetical protein
VESRQIAPLFYAADAAESGVWVCYYPVGDGVQFTISENRVFFTAKTSIAGPGYHAALIDLCDFLQRELGLVWRWDVGGDETGYAQHRNIEQLYCAFLDQFEAFCGYVDNNRFALQGLKMNLEDGLAFDLDEGNATPMGLLPNSFFLESLKSREEMAKGALHFFPWWEVSINESFWLNAIHAMLWSEAEWRAPRTPWEAHIHQAIFAINDRIGPNLPLSIQSATSELQKLSGSDDYPATTGLNSIGWRRRMRAFSLPGPWRINLPGYFIEASEDHGNTICLWWRSEEIRGSSFSATTKDPNFAHWGDELRDSVEHRGKYGKPCVYRLPATAQRSEQHNGFFSARAEFQAGQGTRERDILILTLFDANPEILSRLADIATSVWFNPPQKLTERPDLQ